MIEFQNVSYVYGKHTPFERAAVKNISFKIEDGLATGIIGHTGSGKSTVAQMMNSLICPTQGKVLLDGVDINSSKKTSFETRFKVGLVFQYPEYQLFEETVEKDIAFGPLNMGLDEGEIKERVEMAAEFVGLTKQQMKVSPFDLSGGQKRRVAIAGVIAMKPKTLVLDEPAAGLDPRSRSEILKRLTKYKESGNSLVIISHSMEDVAEFSDKIIALSGGEILCCGTPKEVFSHYEELTESGLALPQIATIMHKIRKKCRENGFAVPEDSRGIFSVEDAYEYLSLRLSERKENDNA
ncbi:MAG: energy-coupling factor transporter ATPase [Ruminococcaceae bacterium]|nr:energy-coupling factor transporter ATPase [Oscillospiraceae bacterium]